MRRTFACLAGAFLAALPAGAVNPGVAQAAVSGNAVSLTLSLPGGVAADVTLSFEQVSGLNLASLGVSALAVNPDDPTLLARLPGGLVPTGYPVILRIEPPPTGGLAFSGIATLEIHTHNLEYTPGCPLRIFSAPLGGPFRDITTEMGAGSYRARSNTGGFSEFLIVTEARPVDQVIAAKLDDLEAMLDAYETWMPGTVYDELEERLEDARADFIAGATGDAIEEIDGFLAAVVQASGTEIPNLWRATRDVHNVGGYLRAGAMTLRFSLALKHGLGL